MLIKVSKQASLNVYGWCDRRSPSSPSPRQMVVIIHDWRGI